MLDIKRIRTNLDEVKELVERRGHGDYGIHTVVELDEKRREILQEVEQMKNRQNTVSKEIPKLKKEGKDASGVLEEMKELSNKIKELDEEVKNIEIQIKDILLGIPNTPHPSVPVGNTDEDNLEVKKWGEPTTFDFEHKAHWDIGIDLGILDFEAAAKITGTRFTVYKGLGARLERAVVNFMLDLHTTEHGFTEILPPFMVNRDSMTGTGQLPKFEEDMFHIPSKDFFLIPTAEVPVTNLYMNDILEGEKLPVYHTAYTPCFRKEAGSAGRDTRGLIRQHQFNKVELVKFSKPEESYQELESLLLAAEEILKRLNIPYRVVKLCTGDLGFSSACTYDIEVWMPSYGRYLEISSCSNFEDFQARRSNIRFRPESKGKVEYVHTLNGSGLAVGRTVAAILENYQQEDGSVIIPDALRGYMGGVEKLTK
ncbi:serine--tRNA ligase [Anaerophilus nitritogenes]|uniref:serine--tRNA ligase n=1 Tax=Anaerophilus nitritogenes TaxID=2498136 RepID=UPI00101B6AAE|nr:serine--tRNA ligase [Anaerophilus nitritogenes]